MTDWTQKKGYGEKDFETLFFLLHPAVQGLALATKGSEKSEKAIKKIVEDTFCKYRKENKENQHVE